MTIATPSVRYGAGATAVRRVLSRALAAGCLVLSAAFPARATGDVPDVHGRPQSTSRDQEPSVGCGKSRAMLRSLMIDPDAVPEPFYLEMLADTDVLHYDLDIEVTNLNPAGNTCTITGTNVFTIQSKMSGLTEFMFRLRNQFTITSALVNGSTPINVFQMSPSTRRADLDRAYALDEVFTLTIGYTGNTVSAAFGSIEVDTQPFTGTPVVSTLSEPYYAYTWWPAKDGDVGVAGDNSDKATIDFSITVSDSYQVPSNGVLQGIDVLSGNRHRYRWSTQYPIVTYLVSFSATTYNEWSQDYVHPDGTMPVDFYIYPGYDSGSTRALWEKVIAMLDVFSSLYGEYPFIAEKYGLYNFAFGGGMEHQTITGQGGFSESLSAHELAHQWWGDAITCKTWSDIWLNEGFATYGECLWEEFKGGSDDMAAYLSAVQSRKPSSVGGSVYVPREDTSNVGRIFDGNLSYRKGCWVLHQLRGVVGDATFFQILADYRAAYEHGAPTTDDFAAVASATYGEDLAWFFQQWVYEIGAPAYQYGWQSVNVGGNDYLLVRIEQTQTAGYPDVFTMPVPLRVTIDAVPQTMDVWNDARTEWFVLPVDAPVTSFEFDPDQWILRTSAVETSYSAGPPRIVATDPAPGEVWQDFNGLAVVEVTFHTEVDVAPADFSVIGTETGSHSFTIASTVGVNPVVLEFAAPLPPDTYTVSASGGVSASNSGMSLDGEIVDPMSAASLPSGDGEAGGAAVWQFEVRRDIPAITGWGMLVLALSTAVAASTLLRRRPVSSR